MNATVIELSLGAFLTVQGWLLLEIVKLKTDIAIIKTLCRERCKYNEHITTQDNEKPNTEQTDAAFED